MKIKSMILKNRMIQKMLTINQIVEKLTVHFMKRQSFLNMVFDYSIFNAFLNIRMNLIMWTFSSVSSNTFPQIFIKLIWMHLLKMKLQFNKQINAEILDNAYVTCCFFCSFFLSFHFEFYNQFRAINIRFWLPCVVIGGKSLPFQ